MVMKKYISTSETETIKIAKEVLDNNELSLILLKGDLGVGKTVFVKGLAKALGIKDTITSPTFGVKNEYNGLTHYDLYLADKKVDISQLIEEDLENGIVVIEWSEKLPKKIQKEGTTITIVENENGEREITIL